MSQSEVLTGERSSLVLDDEPATSTVPARRAQVVQPSIAEVERPKANERSIVRMSVNEHGQPDLDKLFMALSKAQGEFEDLERTRTARIESNRANYTYDFETLADVINATKAALSKHELAVMQFPFPGTQVTTLRTYLGHSSGQWISNDMFVETTGLDPRAIGSAITYMCRYSRKAILGIAASYDDDAEAASGHREAPKPAARRSEKPEATASQQPVVVTKQPEVTHREPSKDKPAEPTGTIEAMDSKDGVTFVLLSSGYKCGTRSGEIVDALRKYKDAGRTVSIIAKPVRAAGAIPVIDQIELANN